VDGLIAAGLLVCRVKTSAVFAIWVGTCYVVTTVQQSIISVALVHP
jgi:hypothetical protein